MTSVTPLPSRPLPRGPQVEHIYRGEDHFVKIKGKEYLFGTPAAYAALHPELPKPPKPPIVVLTPPSPSTKEQINDQKDLLIQNTTNLLTIQYLFEKSYGWTPENLWKEKEGWTPENLRKEKHPNIFEGQTPNSNYPLYTQMLKKASDLAKKDLMITDKAILSKSEKELLSEKTDQYV